MKELTPLERIENIIALARNLIIESELINMGSYSHGICSSRSALKWLLNKKLDVALIDGDYRHQRFSEIKLAREQFFQQTGKLQLSLILAKKQNT